jgi:hypothetical protein
MRIPKSGLIPSWKPISVYFKNFLGSMSFGLRRLRRSDQTFGVCVSAPGKLLTKSPRTVTIRIFPILDLVLKGEESEGPARWDENWEKGWIGMSAEAFEKSF